MVRDLLADRVWIMNETSDPDAMTGEEFLSASRKKPTKDAG